MDTHKKIEIDCTLADLPPVAQILWPHIHQHKIIALYGEMGAGKTTLITTLCKIADVRDTVNSPTFSIINEYKSKYGTIFHMDWYRLKDENEAREAGVEEAIYSNCICFVEWPERALQLLPNNTLNIYLSAISEDKRKIVCTV